MSRRSDYVDAQIAQQRAVHRLTLGIVVACVLLLAVAVIFGGH